MRHRRPSMSGGPYPLGGGICEGSELAVMAVPVLGVLFIESLRFRKVDNDPGNFPTLLSLRQILGLQDCTSVIGERTVQVVFHTPNLGAIIARL